MVMEEVKGVVMEEVKVVVIQFVRLATGTYVMGCSTSSMVYV